MKHFLPLTLAVLLLAGCSPASPPAESTPPPSPPPVEDQPVFAPVEIPEPEEPNIEAENIPLSILYEDQDLLIVDKPKGMVVHPSAGHLSGTLVNAVLYHCRGQLSGINGVLRPGIVHRIDKDTTGALAVCKNDEAHNHVAAQLKSTSVKKSILKIS